MSDPYRNRSHVTRTNLMIVLEAPRVLELMFRNRRFFAIGNNSRPSMLPNSAMVWNVLWCSRMQMVEERDCIGIRRAR
jgi:hypothetical protein